MTKRGDVARSVPARRRGLRLGSRAALVAAALAFQAVVLSAGWLVTFRIVRDSFSRAVENKVIQQNAEKLEEVRAMLPRDVLEGEPLMFGTPRWDVLQQEIESLTDLPGGGFACLLDEDGKLLCHPEIRENRQLAGQDLSGVELRLGQREQERATRLSDAGGDDGAVFSGRSEFLRDGVHYVATAMIPGTAYRLLLHHPQKGLLEITAGARRAAALAATAAGGLILVMTGGGLWWLMRRYDSVHERLNEQMRENLLIARQIQLATLPETLPLLEGWSFAAWNEPADETGGDTYDVQVLPSGACPLEGPRPRGAVGSATAGTPGTVTMLLADAAGHGVGPALAVTQLHAMAGVAWRTGGSLEQVARLMNGELHANLPDGRFVTAWVGALDVSSAALRWVSLGQSPLLVYRAATGEVERYDADTVPLGILDELPGFDARCVRLEPGDAFVAATDGLTEARRGGTESGGGSSMFGVDRLIAVVRREAAGGAVRLSAAIRAELEAFCGERPADDDRTLVILSRSA